MAKFAFTTNTYAGEELEGFVASTLLESDTIDRGLVTVHENVKKRAVIKIVDDAVKLQTPAALFNDQGTTAAQDEKYLDPVAMEFMKQEDWSGLIASWEARKLAPGELRNYDGTVDLSEFMINRYLGKLRIAYDRLFWRGKANVQEATFAATYTGLIPKLIAGSDVSSTKLSDTAYAFSAITAATGIMTVVSTANFRSGDVITITALSTGTTTETTPDIFGVAGSGSVLNQSYIVESFVFSIAGFLKFCGSSWILLNSANSTVFKTFLGLTTSSTNPNALASCAVIHLSSFNQFSISAFVLPVFFL